MVCYFRRGGIILVCKGIGMSEEEGDLVLGGVRNFFRFRLMGVRVYSGYGERF